jgi:RNA polymerase sigma factor (sigma-70 family)
VGRGTSGAVIAPEHDGVGTPADSDQSLVARVRRGDDRAFELLYQRYHRRIHAYVLGMVKDHGRAEDVTQEVFVSALRRMRETEQPLAFKPWLYQIAKNSCIDAFRRSKRAEEVSYDADEGLGPADHSRLVSSSLSPDAAVAAKQDLDSLCGAFGGLSETHHEILVLRELEGLSYAEIGRRMGMSRPAVESTLFRARRRLTEEFDDIVSGARCLRIQAIIMTAADTRLGARDTRRLARHLAHCQTCRREAQAAGLDRGLFTRPPVRERIAARVAGLLPFPIFERFRRGTEASPPPASGRSASFAAHLPMFSDQLASGWGKAAAGAALLVAGVGAGVGVQQVTKPSEKPAAVRTQPQSEKARTGSVKPARTSPALAGGSAATSSSAGTDNRSGRSDGSKSRESRRGKGTTTPSAADRATSAGGGSAQPVVTKSDSTTAKETKPVVDKVPAVKTPAGSTRDPVKGVGDTVKQTGDAVNGTVEQAGNAVDGAVGGVTGTLDGATKGTGPVGDTVNGVTDTVDDVVGGTVEGLNQATSTVTSGLTGVTGSGG